MKSFVGVSMPHTTNFAVAATSIAEAPVAPRLRRRPTACDEVVQLPFRLASTLFQLGVN